MRVLLLSRYGRLGASSRVRSLQYLPYLESKGWQIDISPLFSDLYLQALYNDQSRFRQVIAGYARRLKLLLQVGKYDLIWVEKEILPFMPALPERILKLFHIPYVVDYDDALFHRYDQHRSWLVRALLGRKIDVVMRHARLVLAGNEYLAQRARQAGAARVEIVPTVVDMDRYHFVSKNIRSQLVVGWIGSPSTTHYLYVVGPVIKSLVKEFDVSFVAVGASLQKIGDLPVEVKPWEEGEEVKSIQNFDIGIMPLLDDPWERGKCGYKLIQYMACGVPVVASPVGANRQIAKQNVNGYLADDEKEWEAAIRRLLEDAQLRKKMGIAGRQSVESWYSLQAQSPRLEKFVRAAARSSAAKSG